MIALACCLSIVWTTFTSAPDAYAAVDYAGGEVFGQLAAGAELSIGWEWRTEDCCPTTRRCQPRRLEKE